MISTSFLQEADGMYFTLTEGAFSLSACSPGTCQKGSLSSESVVEAYELAVEGLKHDKETLLTAIALLELGSVQFHQQDTK